MWESTQWRVRLFYLLITGVVTGVLLLVLATKVCEGVFLLSVDRTDPTLLPNLGQRLLAAFRSGSRALLVYGDPEPPSPLPPGWRCYSWQELTANGGPSFSPTCTTIVVNAFSGHDTSMDASLTALEQLVRHPDCRLVLLATADPAAAVARQPEAAPDDDESRARQQRWQDLLNRFTRIPVINIGDPAQLAAALDNSSLSVELRDVLARECLGSRRLQQVGCELLRRYGMGRNPETTGERLVLEVGQLAEDYYQQLWAASPDDEKLMLGQMADANFLNAKQHHVLARLEARGLLVRGPGLRLLNLSFRRFLLATERRQQVARLEEQERSSLWSQLGIPLAVLVIGGMLVLFTTQRESFDTTIAFVSAVAASVPALFRVLAMFSAGKTGSD